MLRRAPTAARPLGRARHAREQARPGAAGWTGMLALAVAAVAADQLTKATVVHALRVGEAVDVLPGLSFWHVRNTGIAFGVFEGRLSFVVPLTGVAVIWMLAFFARSGARHPLVPVAIGLLLGGSRLEPLGSRLQRLRDRLHLHARCCRTSTWPTASSSRAWRC